MVLLPPCEIFHIYLQPLFSQLSGFIYFVIVQLCLFLVIFSVLLRVEKLL